MCCFLMTLAAFGPRLGFLVYWLAAPGRVRAAFDNVLLPLLGVVFLPWTTLAYVIAYGPAGLTGADWVWIALGLILDLATYSGGAARRRDWAHRRR